jgi:hypothetical protein
MAEQSNGEQYQEIESKFFSYKTATSLNEQNKELRKKKGQTQPTFIDKTEAKRENVRKSVDSFDKNLNKKEAEFKEKFNKEIGDAKNKLKNFKSQGKSQLNSLVDLSINTLDKPSGTEAVDEIKRLFIRTIRKTKERVKKLLQEEIVVSLGCSQEQQYIPGPVYIPVKSIDIFGKTLQFSPDETPGKFLYETRPFNPLANPITRPYSFNRELHHRLQVLGQSYQEEYNVQFRGPTGQDLFNITYVTKDDKNNDGQFYRVDLQPRVTGVKVVEFIGEYYSSIEVIAIKEVYTNVLNALTGAITFSQKFDGREQTKLEIVIQRMMGMCYDNKQEIDVSGAGKLDQLDQADTNFTEFDDIENLLIEERVKNILAGVVEYVDCNNIQLPIGSELILDLLTPFDDENLVTSDPDFLAENMLDSLANNPEWKAKIPTGLSIAINKEFLRVAVMALVNTILSPKHLFPLVVMTKSLRPDQENPEELEDFIRYYKKLVMNLVSKIMAIFVEELVNEIKKSFNTVVKRLVNDALEEIIRKQDIQTQAIITAVNIGLTIAAGIQDYRRCQSVIDELKRILNLTQRLLRLTGNSSPVWDTLAQYKAGMSATSMMTKFIKEMNNKGLPTGDLPDGSPNVGMLAQKDSYQSQMDEMAENGKVGVGLRADQVAQLASGGSGIVKLYGNMS